VFFPEHGEFRTILEKNLILSEVITFHAKNLFRSETFLCFTLEQSATPGQLTILTQKASHQVDKKIG
jgi:hypothetical protein